MWENGILRFIDLSNKKEYEKHMDYIVELSKTSTPAVRSASLWRIGKDQFESGKTAPFLSFTQDLSTGAVENF